MLGQRSWALASNVVTLSMDCGIFWNCLHPLEPPGDRGGCLHTLGPPSDCDGVCSALRSCQVSARMRTICPIPIIERTPRRAITTQVTTHTTHYKYQGQHSQLTRDIQPVLAQCWASVKNGGPTLSQHWLNVLCLL